MKPWAVHYYRDPDTGELPADAFLDEVPDTVEEKLLATLEAVRKAPPPSFSGGGRWEAMHGSMNGYYEVRADGPKRTHYRLFCLLVRDGKAVGLGGPSIVVISGLSKAFRTKLKERDYASIREMADKMRATTSWSVDN